MMEWMEEESKKKSLRKVKFVLEMREEAKCKC
jgi:hypothetical protein